jgi:histidinol-phosphate aminotransferase
MNPYRPPLLGNNGKIRLDLNESFTALGPRVMDALHGVREDDLRVYSKNNCLLGALSKYLGVDQDSITIGHGLSEILKTAFESFVAPHSTVLTFKPYWPYYKSLCDLARANLVCVDLSEGMAILGTEQDIDSLCERQISPDLILLTRPHMPTGFNFSYDEVCKVSESFPTAIVFVDEAYWGYSDAHWNEAEQLSTLLQNCPNVIIGRTFSKLFSLASLRVAFSVSSPGLAGRLRLRAPLFGVGGFAERLVVATLNDVEYYKAAATESGRLRESVAQQIAAIPGLLPYISSANFMMVKDATAAVPRIVARMSQLGFAIRDCAQYDMPAFFRVTIATDLIMNRFIQGLCVSVNDSPLNRAELQSFSLP